MQINRYIVYVTDPIEGSNFNFIGIQRVKGLLPDICARIESQYLTPTHGLEISAAQTYGQINDIDYASISQSITKENGNPLDIRVIVSNNYPESGINLPDNQRMMIFITPDSNGNSGFFPLTQSNIALHLSAPSKYVPLAAIDSLIDVAISNGRAIKPILLRAIDAVGIQFVNKMKVEFISRLHNMPPSIYGKANTSIPYIGFGLISRTKLPNYGVVDDDHIRQTVDLWDDFVLKALNDYIPNADVTLKGLYTDPIYGQISPNTFRQMFDNAEGGVHYIVAGKHPPKVNKDKATQAIMTAAGLKAWKSPVLLRKSQIDSKIVKFSSDGHLSCTKIYIPSKET